MINAWFGLMRETLSTDGAITLIRVSLGSFFALSGWHKLFNAQRHHEFVATLMANGVYNHFTEWAVCGVEFSGGCALILGLLTPLASFGLLVIILTAIWTDGASRLAQLKPIDKGDAVCCFLYLPEVMYAIMLMSLILSGPGAFSVDNALGGAR